MAKNENDNMEFIDALLEVIKPEIDGAVFVENTRRLEEVKGACRLLAAAIRYDNPEAEFDIGKTVLYPNSIYCRVTADSVNVEDEKFKQMLNALTVADSIEITPLTKGKVELSITFSNCYVNIGNVNQK